MLNSDFQNALLHHSIKNIRKVSNHLKKLRILLKLSIFKNNFNCKNED